MRQPRRSTPSAGEKPWGIIIGGSFVLLLWVYVTLGLLPRQLHELSAKVLSKSDLGDEDFEPNERTDGTSTARQLRRETAAPEPERGVWAPSTPVPPPISMSVIMQNLTGFLDELHVTYARMRPGPAPEEVWEAYKVVGDRWLLPLDRTYTGHGLFPVRDDDSVFVSVASYRDENCGTTLKEMFSKAAAPEKLFVGLVQQNCRANCRTGVLDGGKVEDAPPDPDCYEEFCSTELGAGYCAKGHVRNLFVDESESLGPAVARYLASKLWQGETYFLQIDAHSLFEPGWDEAFISDIKKTPSFPKSVLSHYPPDTKVRYQNQPGYRICGGEFATDPIEAQIVRLSGAGSHDGRTIRSEPCPAPFVGAGFVFAHSSFLPLAPYDPYIPWCFMGEEILLSMRMWTWGFEIYSPTRNMISHFYVRQHKPKFWETVGRLFKKPGIHNSIQAVIIHRVKHIVGYPESSAEVIWPKSLVDHLDLYGEGPVRPMDKYMRLVGLDMVAKRSKRVSWCFKCESPYEIT